MTPEAINRAAWIATGVSAGVAVLLTLLAALLYRAVLRLTRMRTVAITVAVVTSLLIFAVSPLIMDVVVNALVNPRPVDGPLYVFHVFVEPGLVQKLSPLAAIAATWLVVFATRRRDTMRRHERP